MAQINVTRDKNDKFYRYKMPVLDSKVEGRGNGVKTVISNMVDISRALQTQPEYATKFLGKKVGANVTIDQKNHKYIINGAHNQAKLQNLMYDFIEQYILCSVCGNPETKIKINSKKPSISLICAACGKSTLLSSRSDLFSYILGHPPPVEKTAQKTNDNQDKKTSGEMVFGDNCNQDMFWNPDFNSDFTNMTNLTKNSCTTHENQDKINMEERIDTFTKFIKEKIAENGSKYWKDIQSEAKRLDISLKNSVLVISSCVFENSNPLKDLNDNLNLLKYFCQEIPEQVMFLDSLGLWVSDNKIPIESLQKLFIESYQQELIEEEAYLKWDEKKNNKFIQNRELVNKIHISVEKFITWLKTTKEESDEENVSTKKEEENDDPISKESISANECIHTNGHKDAPIDDLEEDLSDLNIDDI